MKMEDRLPYKAVYNFYTNCSSRNTVSDKEVSPSRENQYNGSKGDQREETTYMELSCRQKDETSEDKYPEYCRTMKVRDANGTVKELVFPKALDLDRPKRARTTFSPEQLYQLEREFQRNQYLVGKERTDLAKRLHLSETQVKVWFQNRRTKYKRDRVREAEVRDSKSESAAACSLMRMLQQQYFPPPPPPPSVSQTVLTPYQSYQYAGYGAT
ncbi:hypothetical protein CHS0354_035159 [Potamilus streckersoni]|uniref:Homeobox domain-containing protein n=1 Tax=Potamilus streckersoni TaxID=2493646 RepID=A0AAE0TF75_9BIVA|nr:hypothetical protein CHS0354_035159 [Potamilus streckersoni]